jgi:hypothetical protein
LPASRGQAPALSVLLPSAVLRRQCPDQQRLLSHEDSLLRHGLVANRDRRPVEAAWLER